MSRAEYRKRYNIMKVWLCVAVCVALAAVIAAAVAVGSKPQEPANATTTNTTTITEPCVMDGYKTCEVVRVYEGDTLVDFYMRGERVEEAYE